MKHLRLRKETAILALPAGILSGGCIGAVLGAFRGTAGLWFCLGSAAGAGAGFIGFFVLYVLWRVRRKKQSAHTWADV